MKPRNIVAPLLVGWLLIMPPLSRNHAEVDEKAPLSQWDTIGSYETSAACKSELDKLTAVISGNLTYSVLQKRALAGKCMAADDPRVHSDNFEMR